MTQLTHAAGEPDLLAPAEPASDSTITPTMSRPNSQPSMKAGPLTRALRLVSMSTTAMIGIGLSAIPTASGSDPPMALPIALLERWQVHRRCGERTYWGAVAAKFTSTGSTSHLQALHAEQLRQL